MRSSIVGVGSRGILEVRGIVECSLKNSWHSGVFAIKYTDFTDITTILTEATPYDYPP
jgi:hypothetical protein